MIPISNLIFVFLVVLIIDRDFASSFYPFIFIQSVVGIFIAIALYFYKPARKLFIQIFPYSVTANAKSNNEKMMFYLGIILIKLVSLIIWPVNLSRQAFLYSLYVFLAYFVFYGICYLVRNGSDDKTDTFEQLLESNDINLSKMGADLAQYPDCEA